MNTVESNGLVTSLIISKNQINLELLYGLNSSSSTVYIQLFDAKAVPINGTVPSTTPIIVPANSNFSLDLGHKGVMFSNGIVAVSSSTLATLTITSATAWLSARLS